jgi:prephenate dehydratase
VLPFPNESSSFYNKLYEHPSDDLGSTKLIRLLRRSREINKITQGYGRFSGVTDVSKRLAYLGPPGTYSEQAATAYDPLAILLPYPSIPSVASAVEAGEADEAIVPIENSLEGSVTFTLDLLIHDSSLFIRNEIVLPIHHNLLVEEGTKIEDISLLYSHPQALAQCRLFIETHLPDTQVTASLSTSAAVEDVKRSNITAAAIANHRSAEIYNMNILREGIEDNRNNVTRFTVLGTSDHSPTGNDKTSLCFSFDYDAPGILLSVLQQFSNRDINLVKIESRPTRQSLGRYIFLLDIEGHKLEDHMTRALDEVRNQVSMLKVFGSYPRQVSSAV